MTVLQDLPSIREAARAHDVKAIPKLETYLTNRDLNLRLAAAQSIHAIAVTETRLLVRRIRIESTAIILGQNFEEVRSLVSSVKAAQKTIGLYGELSPAMIVRLANDPQNPDSPIRRKFMTDLAALTKDPDGDFPADDPNDSCVVIDSPIRHKLEDLSINHVEDALWLLSEPAFRFKKLIIPALSEVKVDQNLTQTILGLTKSRYSQVREAALTQLQGRRHPGIQQCVLSAAYDPAAAVRLTALAMLPDAAPEYAPSIFRMLATDSVGEVRIAAQKKLERTAQR